MNIEQLKQNKPKLKWEGEPNTSLLSQGRCHYYEIYPNVNNKFALDDGYEFSEYDTPQEAVKAAEEHHFNTLIKELGIS